ncbi:MAG TPA: helix-turn-helix transcriptional regulator [Ktedonobacteraceae bacterium]|jgi:transcriptional regulator with XRE-family HTH domain|nr:helix-turn-helix transcriptional regulator [Ktedonobacteraceae bacterium]
MNQLELDRHHELAAFLRSRRARLSPEQVGLPRGLRRRTPGLRRAEVALLAGVSPEWYTRLEQGRDIHVSVQVLESLARVLLLDANERTHVFLLALRQPPPVETFSHTKISPTFQQFLTQLGTIPACVADPRSTIVAWNTAFCAVFGDYATLSERERNSLWRLFTLPMPQRNEEWKEFTRGALAQFRAEYGRFIEDPWWARQIAELSQISPEFRELWARHDLRGAPEGRKSLHHPLVGELTFDFCSLRMADSEHLRLMMYTPRNQSGTTEKIERLLAAGVRHANGPALAR